MLKYKFESNDEEYDNINDLMRDVEDYVDFHELYDQMLDDNGDIQIGSCSYSPSLVLKCVDEIAYNCGYNDFESEFIDEIKNALEDLDDGDIYDDYGIEIECMNIEPKSIINGCVVESYDYNDDKQQYEFYNEDNELICTIDSDEIDDYDEMVEMFGDAE